VRGKPAQQKQESGALAYNAPTKVLPFTFELGCKALNLTRAIRHKFKERQMMLKIKSVASSIRETTLQLDGRVAGQWVELLRESAESVMEEGLLLALDLKNICFIDCEGLALIKSLIDRGVRPVNVPLFVVEQLRRCEAAQGD
jgi:anti-anti-sigma regulatory factor